MKSGWYTSPHNKIFYATELPYMIDGKKVSMREYYLEMVGAEPYKIINNMKYIITIELPVEPNPGTANHFEALLANPNNKIKVLEVKKVE